MLLIATITAIKQQHVSNDNHYYRSRKQLLSLNNKNKLCKMIGDTLF